MSVEDSQTARVRSTVLKSLTAITAVLAERQDVAVIVEALTDDEWHRFHNGFEAVARLKAAWDEADGEETPDRLN